MDMRRMFVLISALLIVSLVGSFGVVEALAPVVIVAAILVGTAIGAIIGYSIGISVEQQRAISEQYAVDTDKYTIESMKIYGDAWANIQRGIYDTHSQFVNNTVQYYIRWAESIASTVCSENKSSISDEDLDLILDDLSQIGENYISRWLDAIYDLYVKARTLAQMRKNAGVGNNMPFLYAHIYTFSLPAHVLAVLDSGNFAASDSPFPKTYDYDGYARPIVSISISYEVDGVKYYDILGYIDLRSGEKYINSTELRNYIINGGGCEVLITLQESVDSSPWGHVLDFARVVESSEDLNVEQEGINIPLMLSKEINDLARLYQTVKSMANTYCSGISAAGEQYVPPPSVALPYDMETLERLDPLARMQLYQTYLRMLAENDWSTISNVTSDDVQGLPNGTIKIHGGVDVDGDSVADYVGWFIPMNIPRSFTFRVNETGDIAGYWYWFDEEGKAHIVKIPENSTVSVEEVRDVKYNPSTGEYEEYSTDEVAVGPQTAREWADMRLGNPEGLEKIDSGFDFRSLFDWWNKLSTLQRIAILVGGLFLLFLLFMALSRGVVVVR
ncbi:MAG: hypothetical protein ACTSVA_03375 [Candidatus Njordarchaeales archaeon]